MPKPKILVVEDSSSIKKHFLSILSAYAICHTAENGSRALELVSSAWEMHEPYDLIIMDIIMPVMDGLTAVEAIRRLEQDNLHDRPPCKILIVSQVTDPMDILESQYRCGADGYITKPFTTSTVVQTIINIGVELPHARVRRCWTWD